MCPLGTLLRTAGWAENSALNEMTSKNRYYRRSLPSTSARLKSVYQIRRNHSAERKLPASFELPLDSISVPFDSSAFFSRVARSRLLLKETRIAELGTGIRSNSLEFEYSFAKIF